MWGYRNERVGQPEKDGTRAAEQREPEERAEHRVIAVLERRFNAGGGNRPGVKVVGLP